MSSSPAASVVYEVDAVQAVKGRPDSVALFPKGCGSRIVKLDDCECLGGRLIEVRVRDESQGGACPLCGCRVMCRCSSRSRRRASR